MYKLRLTYMKSKAAAYIPAIDVCDVISKALIRIGIKLVYNKSRNVRPEITNASTLPIGIESNGEICDVLIKEHIDISYLIKEINSTLPDGMIILGAQYVDLDEIEISRRVYAAIYELELVYDDDMFQNMNKKQIDDLKLWHRNMFESYLNESTILVLKKMPHRQERIDIKEDIIEYKFLIDNRLRITIYAGKERMLNPEYIMFGFLEYINKNLKYNIKRIKILYK